MVVVRFGVTKVMGHADEGMVLDGRVREMDRLGNDAADEAADFGRRRAGNAVIDARRNLSEVCGRWYPVVLDLQRFFIAISRPVVNHDGREGTAPDPMVWSAGAHPKRRRLVHAVRDRAFFCLGRLVFGIRNTFSIVTTTTTTTTTTRLRQVGVLFFSVLLPIDESSVRPSAWPWQQRCTIRAARCTLSTAPYGD